MNRYAKYGLLSAAIIGTLAWLAVGGVKDGQTYFKTIPELKQMGDQAQAKRLRVRGYVLPHSITHSGRPVQPTAAGYAPIPRHRTAAQRNVQR